MAFGKTAGCIILASAAMASAAQFPVRHEHWQDHCNGVLTVDEKGVSFAGPKKHSWSWQYSDIEQLTVSPERLTVITYRENKLGADRVYRFTGKVPAPELYALLKDRLDQRFVAAMGTEAAVPAWTFPVKQGRSEGTLTFGADTVVYTTDAKGESRTWRYSDIDYVSNSGPFGLTVVTFERDKFTFGDRKGFNFELKERLPEATYNEIWMQVQKKNAMIQ
jgi:hypothetical protein